MKKLIFMLIMVVSPLTAYSYETWDVTLYESPKYMPRGRCDAGTRLVLDKGEVLEKFAYLENFLRGECDLYVSPNPRLYLLSEETKDSCGSWIYRGKRSSEQDELFEIEITDHRKRICRDFQPNKIIVIERNVVDAESEILYSTRLRPRRNK